jgi:D-lactate dehydrogenase (cytochrome)
MSVVETTAQTTNALPAAAVNELLDLLGDRFTTAHAVREHHGKGEAYHAEALPDGVAFACSTPEVSEIVKICRRHKIAIIPYGAGTSLEGQILALNGGISIDLSRMNEVLQVNPEDLDCTVQAGVTRKQLNEYLRDTGLFFPVDPGADASIGGMSATRASGTNAVRYGTMRENVLALTVVLADGRIIKTARRARKSSAGYDLTRLFVGSEGTLGVITEVTLRLYGIPERILSAVCPFPSVADAVNAVILTIQSGIPIARCELVDRASMEAICDYGKLDQYSRSDTLFFEFHGSEASVNEQVQMVSEIAAEFGGDNFEWATSIEDRNRLWEARHNSLYAVRAQRKPNEQVMGTDVCVPISRLAECIAESNEDMLASGFDSGFIGHVGDGNFHMGLYADFSDAEASRRAHEFHDRLVKRAIAMDGTCTGEHGIGCGKIAYLEEELGEAVDVMRSIKRSLDPDNLMNPGKVVRLEL